MKTISPKQQIIDALREAASSIGIEIASISLEYPENFDHGDFSSNIALVNAKKAGKSPRAVAEEVVGLLKKPQCVESVSIAGPGFINFKIKDAIFAEQVVEISKDAEYGWSMDEKGKKLMIEYTQPNPFKEFHIGHLMNNAIGESLSRLLQTAGAEVKRATYHGDVGIHVAKTIWGMKKLGFSGGTLTVVDLGKSYAVGNKAFEEETGAKEEITAINKKIYERTDDEINVLYDAGRKTSFDYFESMYVRLGSMFDYHFYESEAAKIGKPIVEEFLKKGVFKKSEGAVIFPGEDHGLHNRVFLNSEGLPTYEAKEIGLADIKYKTFPADSYLTVTANEQNDYFRVVEKALPLIYSDARANLSHIAHGIMRFASGKMSSRTGNVITADALLADIKALVMEKIAGRELTVEQKEEIAEAVAVGAIKYTIVRSSIGSDIIFDSASSISFEGDSGPYLQYATVRAGSILEKALLRQDSEGQAILSKVILPETVGELERLISRFPDVIARARKELAPQYVANYLIALAASFNSFYASQTIIDEADPLSPYRVALVSAFRTIMTNGLWTLGIKVPNKM